MAKSIQSAGSPELAANARCLITYERLAVHLQEAFDLLLSSATEHQMTPMPPNQLVLERHEALVPKIAAAVSATHAAAEDVEADGRRDELLRSFSDLGSGRELVRALVDRHERVQGLKGREGKLPWFQRSERGLTVRSAYAREEPDEADGFMHPARLRQARQFLDELA